MLTVYIHGATATSQSFRYIRDIIRGNDMAIEYDSEAGFFPNLDRITKEIANTKGSLFFVGHSLGGIYSVCLAQRLIDRTLGGVTISTPYGGSEIATVLKYFVPFNRLLKEITPVADPIVYAQKIELDKPWCNIVTTRGNSPWIAAANDGVVTVESQQQRKNCDFIDIAMNHYEVLMDPEVVQIIVNRKKQAELIAQQNRKK
jgi:pimeloyl-ACP methyl ester carboxylesterase